MPWGIKWRSYSPLDGPCEHLMGGAATDRPPQFAGYCTMVFRTKRAAQAYIREHYGYIARRTDLRNPPHCWRMPIPVRVTIDIREAA